jgi:hypothetical protein
VRRRLRMKVWKTNMIVKRRTGLQYWLSEGWLLKSWLPHGIPPLMQKRKKIMKKGSPDGLSFFSY